MSPFICFFHVLRVSRLFVSANGPTSMYHTFSLCVCISFSYVCVCVYVYIYIHCFTRFHSVLFVVYYQFVSLHRCKERKRIRSIFLFYLFSLFRKGYEFIFTRTTCRFLIDVFLVLDTHKIQDNLCVTLLLMSCLLVDVRETN